jgi:hypothetical protein
VPTRTGFVDTRKPHPFRLPPFSLSASRIAAYAENHRAPLRLYGYLFA